MSLKLTISIKKENIEIAKNLRKVNKLSTLINAMLSIYSDPKNELTLSNMKGLQMISLTEEGEKIIESSGFTLTEVLNWAIHNLKEAEQKLTEDKQEW